MVSTHILIAVSATLFSTLAQSRNLLRGTFDNIADARLGIKKVGKPKLIRPLVAPAALIQQTPPGFKPPTQETCDKVAEMAKGEMKEVVDSSCDAVVYGGDAKAPMGCECHFLGDKVKCPWGAPNAGVAQPMKDLGFNRLDNMGANMGYGSGAFKVQNCMYMAILDFFPHSVDDAKTLQTVDHDDVLSIVKRIADSTEWARTFENHVQWAGTIGPWPVDEYGTPNCFGRCTTNPPNVWLRYTTTPAPALL